MLLVILYGLITVLSVIFALNKKKPILLTTPIIALFAFMAVKIVMVPLPLWDTLVFIFGLR